MGAAGIVRVGAHHDGFQPWACIGDKHLAVVALEIQHGKPTANGDAAISKGMRDEAALPFSHP